MESSKPQTLNVVERQGLRCRILCECYALHHNGKNPYRIVVRRDDTGAISTRYRNIVSQSLEYLKSNISVSEIVAAEEYLIKSNFLYGEIKSGIISIITVRGINNYGIDLVEDAVDESKDEKLRQLILDKDPTKIGDYLTACFKYPVGESVKTMVNAILPLLQGAFSSNG